MGCIQVKKKITTSFIHKNSEVINFKQCNKEDNPQKVPEPEKNNYINIKELLNLNFTNLQKSKNIEDNYTPLSEIYNNTLSRLFKVKNNQTSINKRLLLLKKTNNDTNNKIFQEIESIIKLNHSNLLKIVEYYEDNYFYYIITENVSDGGLYEVISQLKTIDINKIKKLFKQMISGISFLKTNGIYHYSIFPDNFNININNNTQEYEVVYFDINEYTDIKYPQGKIKYYIAPEVIDNEDNNQKGDIWSLGVILFILLLGYPPIDELKDIEGTIEWNDLDEQVRDLLSKMICPEDKRITINECLKHPWLCEEGINMNKINKERLNKVIQSEKIQKGIEVYIVKLQELKTEKDQFRKDLKELIESKMNGEIAKPEIVDIYSKYQGKIASSLLLNKIFEEMSNKNQNESIILENFIDTLYQHINIKMEENFNKVFEELSYNKSPKFIKEELKSILECSDFRYKDKILNVIEQINHKYIIFEELKHACLIASGLKKEEENEHFKSHGDYLQSIKSSSYSSFDSEASH